jgi:amidohydrolase
MTIPKALHLASCILYLFFLSMTISAYAQTNQIDSLINTEYPSLDALYKHLHENPELSHQEVKTSARIAEELRKAGYEVTEGFGEYPKDSGKKSYGIVGVMKNGTGPTILVRTDLDALPLEEKTGVPYASKAKGKADDGSDVLVMHACGHDIHMTSFVGTARVLSALKDQWKGTLVMIGQQAEEKEPSGAVAMMQAGLYSKFPKPDYCLAIHDDASFEAGKVSVVPGYALANVDNVDITIRGTGGHGAYPHLTKDPVLIAAETVVALQSIVSREVPPIDAAVVTVGSIHGGTKHNIIPDDVKLQLTVRSYRKEIREQLLKSIERITLGIAQAAGVPEDRKPTIEISRGMPSTYNDPELSKTLTGIFKKSLGEENVVEKAPVMGGEDFAYYSLDDHSIPSVIFWVGAVDPKKVAEYASANKTLPSLHSSEFAPLPEPTIKTGVKAMTTAVLELMKKK